MLLDEEVKYRAGKSLDGLISVLLQLIHWQMTMVVGRDL